MLRRDEVIRRLRSQAVLLSRYGVRSLRLFGSLARDEAREGSDIDLLVEFDRPVGLFHLLRLQEELEQALGATVDLVMPSGLRPPVANALAQESLRVA